jgi:long-subunit acyl-CoA synthetase (AMP-forming)
MPFLAQEHQEIPTKDILSWYFEDPKCDEDDPIYIDAANTSRSYSQKQAKEAIRKVAAGLRAIGLKRGDTVCLHSFNDARCPVSHSFCLSIR